MKNVIELSATDLTAVTGGINPFPGPGSDTSVWKQLQLRRQRACLRTDRCFAYQRDRNAAIEDRIVRVNQGNERGAIVGGQRV